MIQKNVAFPLDIYLGVIGLTVTVTLVLDGAAPVASTNAVSEIGGGWYLVVLAQAEMNYDNIGYRAVSGDYEQIGLINTDVPAATAPSVVDIRNEMDANSTKLAHLDADITSRLAFDDYTIPPTAAANAAATQSALSTELGRIDVSVSSRLPTTTYEAPDNVGIGTLITRLPSNGARQAGEGTTAKNLDQVVTELPSAVQVRQEMDANSTKLDVAVGTRLATAGYTVPPTAVANAAAVGARVVAGQPYDKLMHIAAANGAARLTGMVPGQAGTTTLHSLDNSGPLVVADQDAAGNRVSTAVL